MPANFDTLELSALQDGRNVKWKYYAENVQPMWVADMDFPVAEEIVAAIKARLDTRIGYPLQGGDPALLAAIIAQQQGFGLQGLNNEHLWLVTSTVPGMYAAVLGLTSEGDEVITQTPIYPPFLESIKAYGRTPILNPMRHSPKGWVLDLAQLETLVSPRTKALMLCNPHNPTGRVFSRGELEALAGFVERHDLLVISDELHAELIFDGAHIPFASLSPSMAQRTVTLTGPCKAFNTAGLGGAVAFSHNTELLKRMKHATRGVMGHPNSLTMAMWLAGLQHGGAWLAQARAYLKQNRDDVTAFAKAHPKIGYSPAEATYLAWLDFRAYPFADRAHAFMLEEAKVGLNDGPPYGGADQQGFLRINFATSRAFLAQALQAMHNAIGD